MELKRFLDRVRAVGRVMAYFAFVCAVVGVLATRSVYADVGEQSMIVGRELSGLKDLLGGTHRVRLNGETMFVAEATVPMSAKDVLDRVEALCRADDHGLEAVLQSPESALPKAVKEELSSVGLSRLGILRTEKDGEGAIGCLAHPGSKDGLRGMAERLSRFGKSLDLADVGKLRYVYARPATGGRTQVITAWTDGSVRIDRIFPRDGSEPAGTDPQTAPRPPQARRLLDAEVDGAPYGIRLYDSAASVGEVLQTYDDLMPGRGWSPVAPVSHDRPDVRAFSKDGVDLLLFASRDGERTSVAIIEMSGSIDTGTGSTQ